MKSIFKRRLQLQLLFILLAAVLVAALSVLLISDAVQNAEGVVLADAARTLTGAASELDQQYQDRVSADSAWLALPVAAQDTSLRGVSQAVLRSYPGVEGGYYDGSHFLGYSYPTHDTGEKKTDVPTAELDDILATISQSRTAGMAQRVLRGQHDIVVIEAKADRQNDFASWTMKRLTGRSDPGGHRREILLSALVLAALISITQARSRPVSCFSAASFRSRLAYRPSNPISVIVFLRVMMSLAKSAIPLTAWLKFGRNWKPISGVRTVCVRSDDWSRGSRTKSAIRLTVFGCPFNTSSGASAAMAFALKISTRLSKKLTG